MMEATPSTEPSPSQVPTTGDERREFLAALSQHDASPAVTTFIMRLCNQTYYLEAQVDALERRDAHFTPLMEALQRYVDSDGYEDEIKEQARDALKAADEATS